VWPIPPQSASSATNIAAPQGGAKTDTGAAASCRRPSLPVKEVADDRWPVNSIYRDLDQQIMLSHARRCIS
jgi:hypothetical protein